MSAIYDVLSPWAETDRLPLKGINPRLPDLRGKRVGLYANYKRAAGSIQDAVEAEMRTRTVTRSRSAALPRTAPTTSAAVRMKDHASPNGSKRRWIRSSSPSAIEGRAPSTVCTTRSSSNSITSQLLRWSTRALCMMHAPRQRARECLGRVSYLRQFRVNAPCQRRSSAVCAKPWATSSPRSLCH